MSRWSRTARRGWSGVLLALIGGVVLAPTSGRSSAPLSFSPPVLVSPMNAPAWEPTLLVDRFGNVFITARKELGNLVLSPDPRSPTLTRSMSWLWVSTDGGRTFSNLHGYPLDLENHDWGYEGDIALDDADHLYLVDQNYADSNITRWTISGLGRFAIDFHRPVLPTGQPVDDRPWIAAHGDGHVTYLAQTGAAVLNQLGRGGGQAYGGGRYSAYNSTNGGKSFDLIGHALRGSGACRPAADQRPGAAMVYLVCTNDGGSRGLLTLPHGLGTLWAYVSSDHGETYRRHKVGSYNADAETYDWPLVAVGPLGDVWALHVDAGSVEYSGGSFEILTNELHLFHSTDGGRTWSMQDITPAPGRYRWGAIAVAPSGRLALGIQHRPNASSPWKIYAAEFSPPEIPTLVSVDDQHPIDDATSTEPPSELVGLDFASDGTLMIAWTRVEPAGPLGSSRIYFARSTS